MATPIASRDKRARNDNLQVVGLKVDEPEFWSPPGGLSLTPRLARIPNTHSADISNLMLDDRVLRSRLGTSAFGPASTNVMAIVGFSNPAQVGTLLRYTTTGLDYWNGLSWVSVDANVFSGGLNSYFEFTNWGDEILATNGVNKVYRYNPSTGQKGFIDQSFVGRHIATFGGRVILTSVFDGSFKAYRIRWSVKNDNLDWTGDGSGFEDLFSAPGGRVDEAHGCFPITDDTALIIRENSIWQMSTTGNVLAPFRFSRVISQLGTLCPRSIAEVPGGYAMVSKDNVVIVGLGQVQPIGDPIREALISSITDFNAVVGRYDQKRNEYRLAVGSRVWRFSFRDKGWTRDDYPVQVRDFTQVLITKTGIKIDDLQGKIDDLQGKIDDLVTSLSIDGLMFVGHVGGSATVIAQEDSDATQDVDSTGASVDSAIVVATGLIQAGSVRDKSSVIEIQLEYESGAAQTLLFEYSVDGGANWTSYSTKAIAATTGPSILSVRKVIKGHNIQLRLKSTTLGKLRVLSFTPRIVQDARVSP